ncbi:MAG: Formate dehydrogenase [Candidatus Izimaplasma bacterium HR2]|nr:MAG: Formate dehydrogenase [Candidatus Izimaplasma bacterium HR2]
MKVHATNEKLQAFLKENPVNGITIVDDPFRCTYLISGRYNKKNYNQNLKGVIIPYTSHNGVDIDDLISDNLMLFITPTRSKYVAEKAIALMFALLGNVITYHELLKEGNWSSRNSDSRIPWVSVEGLSIGLFGYGRIGRKIHNMIKGFDCEFYTIEREKEYPSDIILVKNLTNLVQCSDIIIISSPLNQTTESLFDKQLLSRMKNKFLINVGRGKIIEEESLYDALKNNKLKGYASDVWYNYPQGKEVMLPSTYPIHKFDNVVMSNHSGGFTTKTNEEVNQDILKTLKKLKEENFEDKLNLKNLQ